MVKAEEANNRALVKGLAGLGVDIGPVSTKKAIVLEVEHPVLEEKTCEPLTRRHQRGVRAWYPANAKVFPAGKKCEGGR